LGKLATSPDDLDDCCLMENMPDALEDLAKI